MITLYGIRNCDRCRAALRWFTDHGIEHRFHDLRADGLEPELLRSWLARVPPATLINKRSTSWRALAPEQREAASAADYLRLLQATPTLIKRPVVMSGEQVLVGYDETAWTELLG
jgi:Spx/MgsR family transcriptional regulator